MTEITGVDPKGNESVGRAVQRKEDYRFLIGRGHYVSDLRLPGTRHVAFLRSPLAHAKINSIDISSALEADFVEAIFTGESDPFKSVSLIARSALPSYIETAQPILAWDKVRFSGEPIAAVVATDRYLAEDGLELIEVEYERLPANVSAWSTPAEPLHKEALDNVLLERRFQSGDVKDALAGAEVVIERELISNRQGGNPLECRAGVALFEPGDGTLQFWSGTQVPHLVRNALAELMGMSEAKIRVVAPDVGGGFGTKAALYPEDVAICMIARLMPGSPIKWVEDRAEHLLSATHARDHRYLVTAGFSSDGTLLALKADVTCNVGAYSVYPWTAGIEPLMAGGLLSGPYRLENYDCMVRAVATNSSPSGPYRGVARPASVFAMEAIMDEAARRLGMSTIDIRRKNFIGPQDIPYKMPTRLVDDSGHYERCLDKALELFDLDQFLEEQQRRRGTNEPPIGFGVACYNELTGLGRAASAGPRMPFRTGHDACTVKVNPDGTVTVFSGVTSQGQGLETTVAQIVADGIGVDYDDVQVRIGNTDESLWGFGAFSSRQAVIGGGAAQLSALVVRDKVIRLASELLEIDINDLILRDGKIWVAGEVEPRLSLAEIARVAYLESNRLPDGMEPGLEATRFYDPIRGAFAAGVQIGSLEVDVSTGEIRILKWVCVEDAGRVINPAIVDGQIAGAIAQGIGGAMYEHLIYDGDGNLSTGTLMDYLIPTSGEIPEMIIGHLQFPADNPLGVRGVGEGGTLGPNAVIAGAVADALGILVDQLPVTEGAVWEGLQ